MLLKCKMCGGDLKAAEGLSTCECEYCGSVQTIPVVDDERIASLYNKANALRQAKEFDKAQMVYESIMEEKPDDAEASWGAALCHFGIEYVEDPYSHERKPTLHRMQYESILTDRRYEAAIEKADAVSADLYQQEAGLIDRILKRYQAISAKEKPFDVFICYKETEIGSRSRTKDSVYAQEIYDALTKEDYHVFFSRITLEDKLGEAYEPYIFAALNSAKVMLVVGTSKENIESDWVQNEWRRYLFLMQKDSSKKLIPVYRDMDAYELPEEFVYLQSQDYSKIGAMQDLVRGVEKIVGKKKEEPTKAQPTVVPVAAAVAGGSGMLERAFLFLEDGNFDAALERAEKVLDQDPKNARAYLAKLMIARQVRTPAQLANADVPFDHDDNYQKLMRFGDEKLKKEVSGYLETINHRIEQAKLQKLYDQAIDALGQAKTIAGIVAAKRQFEAIANFRDARTMMDTCDKAREELCEKLYRQAAQAERNGRLQEAATQYKELGAYRDAQTGLRRCEQKLAEEKRAQRAAEEKRRAEEKRQQEIRQAEQAEKERQAALIAQREAAERKRKVKRNGIVAGVLATVAACVSAIYILVISPMLKYNDAVKLLEQGNYTAAIQSFTELNDYRDSAQRIQQARANNAYANRDYEAVETIYTSLDKKYQDHAEDLVRLYQNAEKLLMDGKYDEAAAAYAALGNYREAASQVTECTYQKAVALMKISPQEGADLLSTISGYKDTDSLLAQYVADNLYAEGKFAEAWEKYAELPETYHTHDEEYRQMYAEAMKALEEKDYDKAYRDFISLGGYSDAKQQVEVIGKQQITDYISAEKYEEAAEVYKFLGDQENAAKYTYLYAKQLFAKGEYWAAAEVYTKILDYEDSREQRYLAGLQARQEGKLKEAFDVLSLDPDYRDAQVNIYQTAVAASTEYLYEVSVPAFTMLGAYKDSAMKVTMDTYAWGAQLFESQDYDRAAEVYGSMGDFSDAADKALEARYAAAVAAFQKKEYMDAAARFASLGDYEDSAERREASVYAQGMELLDEGKYAEAKELFTSISGYGNSTDMILECDYRPAVAAQKKGEYAVAQAVFLSLGDYRDAVDRAKACAYQLALAQMKGGAYAESAAAFDALEKYEDSETQAHECRYILAAQAQEDNKLEDAIQLYLALGDYKDSQEKLKACNYLQAGSVEQEAYFETAYELYGKADSYQDAKEKAKEMAYRAGMRMSSAGEYENAIIWLERAGKYQDAEGQILNIGEYYYSTSQYDKAEDVYERISYNAAAQKRLYELGQYYELVGDLESAARNYREAGEYEDAEEKAKEDDYQRAIQLMASENYETAKEIMADLQDYKDVESRIETCENAIAAAARAAREAKLAPFRNAGSYVTFGNYEQDNNTGNGKEEIEWLVLEYDEANQKALLLSRYGLETKPYNTTNISITWEDCTLRTWLNQDFLNTAFTAEEQQAIKITNVSNSKGKGYSGWSTNGGNDTQDKVFLLSYSEAFRKYFISDSERQTKPTEYAKAQGAYENSKNGNYWWWLRSPGSSQNYAALVNTAGSRSSKSVNTIGDAVRPALWLDLTSDIF